MHTLFASDGAAVSFTLQGGQLCSWRSPDGNEQLYTSPNADFSGRTAIRGGIPVIFPQFGTCGPLPRHGFARLQRWKLLSSGKDKEGCGFLRAGFAHRADALFGHDCELTLDVSFGGDRLEVALSARNLSQQEFAFTAALHSYLAAELMSTEVLGLEACAYQDSAQQDRTCPPQGTPLRFGAEVDRIYRDVPGPLTLRDSRRCLAIGQQGFPDVVVWNPGPERGPELKDLPPLGWRRFVCVEAALVGTPQVLRPGSSWRGLQTFQVRVR